MGTTRCNRGRERILDVTREEAKGEERKDHTTTAIALRCGMLELPLPLIFDILLRLPLRAVLSCKRVCKTFREVIRDPYFSEDLLIKSSSFPTKLVIRQGHHTPDDHSTYFLANLSDLETSSAMPERCGSRQSYATPSIRHKFTSSDGVWLLGSCNGFVCLMPFLHMTPVNTYYICNPLLGEFIVIPPVTQEIPDHTYVNFSKFVFAPKSKQYKIVHFSGQKDPRFDHPKLTVAEIYTLGSDSWSSTGEVPSPVSRATLDSCLNGVLHWVSKTKEASDLICSLDLDTEKFQYVSPPPHVDSDFLSTMYGPNVGVMNECLCLCYYHRDDDTFDVWVMKEYGSAESWALEFYIDLTPFDKPYDLIMPDDFVKLVGFLDNGDLLFERTDMILISYNRETETFKSYKSLSSGLMTAFVHVPSLLSLKVIADGKYADSVKQIRKTGFGWTGFIDVRRN